MNDQQQQHHPITPPPELVQQWIEEDKGGPGWVSRIATRAAQWGADQELEACCYWLGTQWLRARTECGPTELRAARRPKPPSLWIQGLRILVENGTNLDGRIELDPEDIETFHAVLERLKQLEDSND